MPMIESRTCIISRDKGIKLQVLKVLTITEVIVECAGVSMDLQVPLLIIDLRGVSIISALFANRRVTHLRVVGHHFRAHMFHAEKNNKRRNLFH